MDWNTEDYTRTYSDTIYVPPPECDEGIYILDDARRDTDPTVDEGMRTPLRPYCRDGRYGVSRGCATCLRPYDTAAQPTAWETIRGGEIGPGPQATSRQVPSVQEDFYGNIRSDRRNNLPIFAQAWDERPQHYRPSSGFDWSHLVPTPDERPPYGGPAAGLAYPPITQSEGVNRPWIYNGGEAPQECRKEGLAPAREKSADRTLSRLLLFIIVVLVAILVVGRCVTSGLEATLREAILLARAPAGAAAAT